VARVSRGRPFFCPCPPPVNAVLRSDGRSLMHGGGRSTLTRGGGDEREARTVGREVASWMMPLLGRALKRSGISRGALSGALDDSGSRNCTLLLSCHLLSSLRLYCREGEEREECESRSRSLHSSSRSSHAPRTPHHAPRAPPHLSHTPLSSHCSCSTSPPKCCTLESARTHPPSTPPCSSLRTACHHVLWRAAIRSLQAHWVADTNLEVPWCMHCLSSTYKLTVHPHALTVFRNEPGWLTEEVRVHALPRYWKTSRNRDTRTITKSTLSL